MEPARKISNTVGIIRLHEVRVPMTVFYIVQQHNRRVLVRRYFQATGRGRGSLNHAEMRLLEETAHDLTWLPKGQVRDFLSRAESKVRNGVVDLARILA